MSLDCDPQVESKSACSSTYRDGIVKFILAKKVTRSTTYYQVCSIRYFANHYHLKTLSSLHVPHS